MSNAKENEHHLGDYLRQEREKKGFTLEQVSSATKINIKVLHFLEAGQFSELPSRPFLRGFITAYCQFVGLEPTDTLTRFDEYISEGLHGQNNKRKNYSEYSVESKDGDPSKNLILGILVGFIFIGLVSYFIMKPKLKKKHQEVVHKLKTEEIKAQEQVVEQAPVAQNEPEVEKPIEAKKENTQTTEVVVVEEKKIEEEKPVEETDPLQKGDSYPPESIRYRVVLQAKESFWVRYKVDEFQTQSFVLLQGKYLVLKAMKSIAFQTSNVSAVLIKKGTEFLPLETANSFKRSGTVEQSEYRLGDPKVLAEASPLSGLEPIPVLEKSASNTAQ